LPKDLTASAEKKRFQLAVILYKDKRGQYISGIKLVMVIAPTTTIDLRER
jgi:hypothetical protein